MLILFVLLPCFLILFVISMLAHNTQLSRYDKALRQLEHPMGTSRIASKKDVSSFWSKNACDYFVGELRQYSGASWEIRDFYVDQPREDSSLESIELLFIENGEFPEDVLPDTLDTLEEWGVSSSGPGEKLYIIYFSTTGASFFDYRCR